ERLRKVLEAKGSQEEAKKHETGHRAVARSYRATSRVPGAFSDAFYQRPRDRTVPSRDHAGAKSKLQYLLTVRQHGVPRDRTVPFDRTKIKDKNGISSFRARSKALARPNPTYMEKEQLKHKKDFLLGSILDFRIVLRVFWESFSSLSFSLF
ncbi:hypothetical protein PIB30_095227, partial [Stylosanthes scabra]|nr:hypothetical protein [Stylosanthes scabra]